MKANRKFVKDNGEEAVSAVIGVILMVAITVAIAATVYVYVSGLIGGTSSTSSTMTMNVFSQDDDTNTTIWIVSGVEGESIDSTKVEYKLLDADTGQADATAVFTFFDNSNPIDGDINSGDTISVAASADGSYSFLITDSATGNTIFKSANRNY